jgi:hypothetical protein
MQSFLLQENCHAPLDFPLHLTRHRTCAAGPNNAAMSITAEPVGAGLPAKAACQATRMLDVPFSSRASPLPQGSVVDAKFFIAGKLPCATGFPAAPYLPSDLRRWAK